MRRPRPELACPRCGYDVSGIVPTWTEACPLDGICSECGLRFAWVDIYRPERVFPRWSFEHARRWRLWALVRTVFKTLRPKRLWTEMSLAAPIRRGRLVFFAALLVALTHLGAAGVATRLSWDVLWDWWKIPLPPQFLWGRLAAVIAWPYWPLWSGWWKLVGPLGALLLAWGVMVPLPYLVLVDTMAKAKCRPAHLLRGWMYFLPTLCVVLLVDAVMLNAGTLAPSSIWAFLPWPLWQGLLGVLAIGPGVWYVRWWWLFTSTYLRLEQARLVLTLMMVVSLLASLAICTTFNQDLLDLFGSWINFLLDPAMKGTERR